ncbi:MAG: FlgD immunoglobulin-like domain containing protein, partial [Calditrichia bacterium]
NYPNPFNPTTTIKYGIPETGNVSVVVYNTLGQKVRTLVSGNQEAGYYEVIWDGTNNIGQNVGSGIFFYRVESNGQAAVRKMILMK